MVYHQKSYQGSFSLLGLTEHRILDLLIFGMTGFLSLIQPVRLPATSTDDSPKNGAKEAISTAERVDREIFFETKIRPLLVEKCLNCHRPERKEGHFSVIRRDEILKFNQKQPRMIIPGNSKQSRIFQNVLGKDQSTHTPQHKIRTEPIQNLQRWVDDGMIWTETMPSLLDN
ncbi:MAG: hypothetical protein RJA81_61 [Planctomycetota bacterium]|jgi:hypothetical protein